MAPPPHDAGPLGPSAPSFNPETEPDPLIRAHITMDPITGEAVFRAMDYPVWAVVLNLRASDHDWNEVQRTFPELPPAALRAAERFAERYPADAVAPLA